MFLEVNPIGQWLDLEVDAGHAVSAAVASVLWHGPSADRFGGAQPFAEADIRSLERVQEHSMYAGAG